MPRIPLAWKNLTHSIPKLAVSVSGVTFAVVLMFMQRGFLNGMLDSTVEPIKRMKGELIVVSEARYSMSRSSRFPLTQLIALENVPGVVGSSPLYVEMLVAVLRKDRKPSRPIRVFGVDLDNLPFQLDAVNRQLDKLRAPGTALIDRRSKRVYNVDLRQVARGHTQTLELAGQSIDLVGVFSLSTDFANEGNLLMSSESFASYFPFRGRGGPLEVIDLGLLECGDADPVTVKQAVERQLAAGLTVMTKAEFTAREKKFWSQSTPVGIIFGIGTVMGFVVGVIICYQVIYTDINDHMAEFATLRAMGYSNWYFLRLVGVESVLLSLFGFFPGLLISLGLFQLLGATTGLLMTLNLTRGALILGLTLLMCLLSGGIALRRLVTADPASLF